jgi:hypothetical protein
MLNKNRSPVGTIVSTIIALVLVSVSVWVILNRQFVFDQWNVWQYQPTSSVESIKTRAGLSEQGTFYFYTSQPQVNSATDFNANCERQEAKSAILGCYANSQIFIYDVQNPQLDGIEEVTAAHEMLHAIWARMGPAEQKRVGGMLEAEYASIVDASLKERMDYYDRNEPGERANELHSIIGTEFQVLNPELEAYFKKYFSDRSKVVALHAGYEKIFNDLRTESETLLLDINVLRAELTTLSSAFNTKTSAIDSDYAALKSDQATLDRSDEAAVNAYNRRVSALQQRIDALSAERTLIIAKQNAFNEKVAQYNALVVKSNELNNSLDSSLDTVPTL